jgi:drug/metabolite transporter (DMT)-like permease
MNPLSDINFLDAKGLAEDFRNQSVSEARTLRHLIALTILGLASSFFLSQFETNTPSSKGFIVADFLLFAACAVVSYYGIWLTYQTNAKGDGEQYFPRFAALSLPVTVQVTLAFIILSTFLLLLVDPVINTFGISGAIVHLLLTYFLELAFVAFFYLRMRAFIAIASKPPAP